MRTGVQRKERARDANGATHPWPPRSTTPTFPLEGNLVFHCDERPGVEPDVPATPFLQIDAPRLAVRATQDQHWAGLVLRTSPYGWIGFNLDRTQAADLGRHLTDLATRLRPAN